MSIALDGCVSAKIIRPNPTIAMQATGQRLMVVPVAGSAAPSISLTQAAAAPELMATGAITRSVAGAPLGFSVTWPDGGSGTYSGTESTQSPGAIDTYAVSYHLGSTDRTYTQPPVTRDPASAAVTNRPPIVVS